MAQQGSTMPVDFIKLAKPDLHDLQPYQAGKPRSELKRELGLTHIVKLASNENPLGPSPKALAALQQEISHSHWYPDGNAYALKHGLAEHLDIPADEIILGNGSDNILAMIAQCYLPPGGEVIMSQYAFATFAIITTACQGVPRSVPCIDWQMDLDGMLAAINDNTRLIFIANPNNPTGNYCSHDALYQFMQQVPEHIIVTIDEAYFEYVTEDDYPNTMTWQAEFPNLITTRTFSKVYGLAGLRIGYARAHPDIVNILNRIRLPFNVNRPAQAAALTALNDHEHLHRSVQTNTQGKEQLAAGLQALGLPHRPSVTNFLTVKMPKPGRDVFNALLKEGIIIRPLDPYGLHDYCRISIGLEQENAQCLNALKSVLSNLI
jgi:histidinol-phosphate aminotransferase